MAIIGKIRERSTLVLIIIGGAIMAFVLSDLFSSRGSVFTQTRDVAEVNGEKISFQEFEMQVQEAFENYQMNTQADQPLSEEMKSNIREQVWTEMLREKIMGGQMAELGITVTVEELFDMVQGNDPHPEIRRAFTDPETGQYNSANVVRFLQGLPQQEPEVRQQWIAFERSLKKNRLQEKYANLVKKGLYFTSAEGQMSFTEANRRMNWQYVMSPYSAVADNEVQVTDEDIKKYYNEHKNNYEQDASRKIVYAYFPVNPSETDREFAEKWVQDTYNKFQTTADDSTFVSINSDLQMDYNFYSIEEFPEGFDRSFDSLEVGSFIAPAQSGNTWRYQKLRAVKMAPDSVKARHILVNVEDRSKERAKEIADSLVTLLDKGANFAEMAQENSDDVASGKDGGELGWFTEGMMVKPFNDAAFEKDTSGFKLVESQFGYHIIDVVDVTALKKKYQVAMVERLVSPSQETYADAFNKANSFSINASGSNSFEAVLDSGNITKREAVIGANDVKIAGLENSRELVRWIADANEDDVSPAFDVQDAFVVVYVKQVNKKGTAPLESLKDVLKAEVMKQKKAEVLKKRMAGFDNLNTLASEQNLQVQTADNVSLNNPMIEGAGYEAGVVGTVSTLEQGQVSVPLVGNAGVFVVQVTSVDEPQDPNIESGKRMLAQGYSMRIDNNAVFEALKDNAEISDNRSKFY